MGDTGKRAVERNGLAFTTNQKELQNYYRDTYGIEIGGSYFRDKNDPSILYWTAQELDKLLASVPKEVIESLHIRIRSKNLTAHSANGKAIQILAQTYSNESGYIDINKNRFGDGFLLNAVYDHNASNPNNHFHPIGTHASDIIVHEVGHQLENAINKKLGISVHYWHTHTTAETLVKQSYAELPKAYRDTHDLTSAIQDISKYADMRYENFPKNADNRMYGETFAEAVADCVANGKKAKPLSRKIWKNILRMLK